MTARPDTPARQVPASFDNETVIVTGAAGALGSDLVRRFADEGANVVVDMAGGGDTDVDAPEA